MEPENHLFEKHTCILGFHVNLPGCIFQSFVWLTKIFPILLGSTGLEGSGAQLPEIQPADLELHLLGSLPATSLANTSFVMNNKLI